VRVYGLGEREAVGRVSFHAIDDAVFVADLAACTALVAAAEPAGTSKDTESLAAQVRLCVFWGGSSQPVQGLGRRAQPMLTV
jgi:hypothetical protein